MNFRRNPTQAIAPVGLDGAAGGGYDIHAL
jgi:hypothetical protein